MRPPLLKKQEIDVLKAKEKSQDVAEGLKLTRRIDGLRELATETETNYQRFTSASLQTLQVEIDAKATERDELEEDLRIKRAARMRLLEPLEAKWQEVNRTQRMCTDWESELREKEKILTSKAAQISVQERNSQLREEKSSGLEQLASQLLSQSEKSLAAAKEESASMRNKAQEVLSSAEFRELEISKREGDILAREDELNEKSKKIEIYEIGLTKRELTLKAGWKNLERTAQKLKQ